MAIRRRLHTLIIRSYSTTSFNNSTPYLHPIFQLPTVNSSPWNFKSAQDLSPSEPFISGRFPAPFSLFSRNFCSSNRADTSEDEDDDNEEDYESEVEGSDEDDDRKNVDAGKTDEEKAQEAAEIGYKVFGPLQESDQVFNSYKPVFAVVQIGSHQFKVSIDDSIYVEKLKYCDVNDKLILNKVLMLGSAHQTLIGRPVLPQASVHAVVEEHALDAKVIIFKKKRRKNYRRTKGHRQELTKLRITDIKGIGKSKGEPSVKAEKTPSKQEKEERVSVAV